MKKVIIPDFIKLADFDIDQNQYACQYEWCDDAEIVFYKDNLDQALELWNESSKINHFVSLKNYLSDKNLELDINPNKEMIAEVQFENKNISLVREELARVIEALSLEGYFLDIKRYLITIGLELIQNALIQIKKKEVDSKATLRIYESSKYITIEVIDRLGSLMKNTVLNKIKRAYATKSFEEKKEGAGLGFYMLLEASDKIFFDIIRNQETKVVCQINRYKRLKEYKSKNVSLHFFIDTNGELGE